MESKHLASLPQLGFTSSFARSLADLKAESPGPELLAGRVVFESQEHYRLATAAGELDARPAGRLRREAELPAVGDWVAFAPQVDGVVPILHVLPRRTCLSRKVAGEETREQVVAANVDSVFVVMGLDGDFNLRRLERYVVMIGASGAQPVVVLSKADLHPDPAGARLDALGAASGAPVHCVATPSGEGLEPLRAYLEEGKTVALVGSSGAGKSTLLNGLCGQEVMRTGAVRGSDDRGRHTTTHRQLVRLPGGGLLIDNPGIREIQLWAGEEDLSEAFEDLEELARSCRFRDCRHQGEPGCEVQAALADGRLDPGRFRNWLDLQKEIQHLERRRDVAASRKEDRRLGRLYKRVQAEKNSRR
ncbi:MAG: ribosome small subunit-dependent GTPase A [Acidobacteria bacterium]|nr:ribosome small subunit-dependent GTPase A [Acidobacteriota bacterium]